MTLYLQDAMKRNVSDIYIDQGTIFFREDVSLIKTQYSIPEFGAIPLFCERKARNHIRLLPQDLSAQALQYPPEVSSILSKQRGLILCIGASTSGKTTLILHLLKHTPSTRISAYNTHVKSSSPYRVCSQHLWCATDEVPDIEVLTIRSPETALHALMNASNRLIIANIKAKGMQDGLSKLMLFLHSYPKEYILDLLATYINCFVSTVLVSSQAKKKLPLIGIAQANESLAAQIRQGNFHIIEEFIQKGNAGAHSLSVDLQLATWLQNRQLSLTEATSNAINPSKMQLRASGIIHND